MEAKSGAPVAGYWSGLWDLAVSPAPAADVCCDFANNSP